jgi:hypothetical protein
VSASLFRGDAPLSESPVSCPLPSLAWPLVNCPPIDPIRSEPRRGFSLGASDVRAPDILLVGTGALFPALKPAVKDCLGGRAAGAEGGAIGVCPPARLGRGLAKVVDVVVTDGFLRGAPARVAAALDEVEDSCLVGDFAGDCDGKLALQWNENLMDILEVNWKGEI